jgi:Putative porin
LKSFYIVVFSALLLTVLCERAVGQNPGMRQFQNAAGKFGRAGGAGGQAKGGDSLQHRTGLEDSITLKFRFLDTSRFSQLDSSVLDFTGRYPLSWNFVTLGNFGNAAENRIFSPRYASGWDHGFHSYDAYNFTLAATRFYNTTRPYSEIGYMLGSLQEQYINLLHTQNVKPNWNMSIQYRLINAPGAFQNQNTNHNSYRFTSWFQSKNKRYQNFFVILGNKLMSGENGGIKNDLNYLDSSVYRDNRYIIPTQIGGNNLQSRNFFTTNIVTGTFNTNATYLMRQQFDLGQKDSIVVNDTTVIPLFYPRLRMEHTISYNTYNYRFRDTRADSLYYANNYQITIPTTEGVYYQQDYWKVLLNDFSIYTFPDAKNSQQFLKAGISFQMLKGEFDTGTVKKSYTNLWLHGEYRNKTRNKKWDIEAYGAFYLNGYNSGDYDIHGMLKRLISPKFGYVELGFENVNRTPSFTFDPTSSFYLDNSRSLNKENNIHFYAALDKSAQKLHVSAHYQLLSNYTYLTGFYKVAQASSLFTVFQVMADKDFKVGKKGWHWRTWIVLQQRTGSADLNLPLISTRNQFAYDGNLGFKNLFLTTGVELRYFTPYKVNQYSPLQGQFFFQENQVVHMKAPELTAYANFRIRGFSTYVRLENLNALNVSTFKFTNNNLNFKNYPSPGMQIRVGVFWSFVN